MPSRQEVEREALKTLQDALDIDTKLTTQDIDIMLFYNPQYIDLELRIGGHIVAELANQSINQREFEKQIVAELTQYSWCREVWIWWASSQ
jgi:hypothetical protein